MTNDLQAKDRVRVSVHRSGRHLRNFYGIVIGMTRNGEVSVREEKKGKACVYPIDQVKLLKP